MKKKQEANNSNDNIIIKALKSLHKTFIHLALFSFIINILNLALPIYSLQVLDRVLGSSSIETLLYLLKNSSNSCSFWLLLPASSLKATYFFTNQIELLCHICSYSILHMVGPNGIRSIQIG